MKNKKLIIVLSVTALALILSLSIFAEPITPPTAEETVTEATEETDYESVTEDKKETNTPPDLDGDGALTAALIIGCVSVALLTLSVVLQQKKAASAPVTDKTENKDKQN